MKTTIIDKQKTLECLIKLAKNEKAVNIHPTGVEYTAIMSSFLIHMISAADSLLKLGQSHGDEWFPVTVGNTIVRPMFEVDVNARYITKNPKENALKFVEFDRVIEYKYMNAIKKQLKSESKVWSNGLQIAYNKNWKKKNDEIENNFKEVESKFTKTSKKGKKELQYNWSGISIREMSGVVDLEEMYVIFYSYLSNFTHGNVTLIRSILKINSETIESSMRPNTKEVESVFNYAVIFLASFLELYGEEFNSWSISDIDNCRN